MEDTLKIERKIRSLFRSSEWPVPIDEIQVNKDRLLPKAEDLEIYSPFYIYNDGQRLFHPAESIQGWFTVEVVNSTTILAHFDNGEEKRLAQGEKAPTNITGKLRDSNKGPRQLVYDIMEKMDDVQKIGTLYAFKSMFESFPLHRFSALPSLEKYVRLQRNKDPALIEERKEQLNDICKSLGFESLIYVVRLDNFLSILKNGILCKNLAPYDHKSFAKEEIQKKRHAKIPSTEFTFNLHDYVPLFFSKKPPLLYNFQYRPQEVLKIYISPDVLLEPGVVFYDMNACSDDASPYTDIQDLRCLDWKIIHHPRYWKSFEESQRIENLQTQAEADIPLRIFRTFFQKIVFANQDACFAGLQALQETECEIPISFESDFF